VLVSYDGSMREFLIAMFIFGSLATFAVTMDNTPAHMEVISVNAP